jgi:Tol biopolymer transport system component
MATGKMAFLGKTTAMVHKAILDETPPPPSSVVSELPERLDEIIAKALEKDRELRYQGAADLRVDLSRLKRDTDSAGVVVSGATAKSRRQLTIESRGVRIMSLWLPAVGLALIALVSFAWWYRGHHDRLRNETNSASMSIHALTESGDAPRGAIAPDGRYVAYVKTELENEELRLLQVATERDVQLLPASPMHIGAIRFSPDGNFVYFLRQPSEGSGTDDLFRIAALGGPATPIATNAVSSSVTVSPDGKRIAYIEHSASESSIVAIDPNGGNRQILAKRPSAYEFWFVEWSRAPNTLAVSYDNQSGTMTLATLELPTGSIHELDSSWGVVGQPVWGADGTEIFVPAARAGGGATQIWRFDAHTGAPSSLTSNSTNFAPFNLAVSASGDLLATTISDSLTLWVMDQHGRMISIPSLRSEGENSIAWVGDQIVSSNASEMIVHDLAAQSSMKLRPYSEGDYHWLVRCGPKQIAYVASSNEHGEHVSRTDITTGSTIALTQGPADEMPTCTPDGSRLVYVRWARQVGIYSLEEKSIDWETAVELHQFDRSYPVSPTISPDGDKLLLQIVHSSGDPCEWAMTRVSGGELKKLTGLPRATCQWQGVFGGVFKWAPDGKSMLYKTNQKGVDNIWSVALSGGVPKKLTDFHSDLIFAFDVSSDNRLAVSRGKVLNDLVLLQNVP